MERVGERRFSVLFQNQAPTQKRRDVISLTCLCVCVSVCGIVCDDVVKEGARPRREDSYAVYSRAHHRYRILKRRLKLKFFLIEGIRYSSV